VSALTSNNLVHRYL